ncbi:MAG: hypothetical protein AABO58_16840 [Acidobacteriota bacterium]
MIFAIAARDEIWSGGRRLESRLMHGIARQHGDAIAATDDADEALLAACEERMVPARAIAESIDARVRVVVRATREGVETTFTVTIGGVSIVSTPEHIDADTAMLRHCLGQRPTINGEHPLVWHNGSAAVLLHEAFGHAAEHHAPPVAWPEWLHVDAPLAPRRASFSDVPLPRMTHLLASQVNAPFELPEERVDVHLIAGGGYDPVTDVATVHVAIPRFTIRATRAEIARSLRGATGEPLRYPGVICSREGQELHVPSAAPLMVTGPL